MVAKQYQVISSTHQNNQPTQGPVVSGSTTDDVMGVKTKPDGSSTPSSDTMGPKPAPIPVPDIPKPIEAKKELTLPQIQALMDEAVGYTVAAVAAKIEALKKHDVPTVKAKKGEVTTERKNLEDLTNRPIVMEAEKSGVEDMIICVKVIKLLLVKAEREEKDVMYWVAVMEDLKARNAETHAQLEMLLADGDLVAQKSAEHEVAKTEFARTTVAKNAADKANVAAAEAWDDKRDAEQPIADIAQAAFVKMLMGKMRGEGITEGYAEDAFKH
jgi:hypothetical protein